MNAPNDQTESATIAATDDATPARYSASRRRIAVCGVVLLFAALVQWHKPIGRWAYGWYYHQQAGGPGISAKQAVQGILPDTILLDTREPAEFAVSHLDGAINRPYSQIDAWLDEFGPGDRIITYCTVGYRSGVAARRLAERGAEAQSVIGGILAAVAEAPDWLSCPHHPPAIHVWEADYAWLAPEGVQPIWNSDLAALENGSEHR